MSEGKAGKGMSDCARCVKRGQTWNGSAPRCAFKTGEFSNENWNCATANNLRSLAGEDHNDAKTAESLYLYRDDQSYAALFVPPNENDIPDGEEIGPFRGGGFIAMSWYKHRGQTDMILRVDPRDGGTWDKCGMPLTLAEAEAAIKNIEAARKGQP